MQTNKDVLEQVKKEKGSNSTQSLSKTITFLSYLGINPSDLNQLNVIHVSGTKGKGSTCAFTENILRKYGFKTGFYSSPHLIAVRERFRINGEPISKEKFTDYFWNVYKLIESHKPEDMGMPPYFMFLTVMAFKYFLKEKVDVAVVEVGIGGEYDCTNIVPKPIVTGVTSLGLDHCSILGQTIDKIAWQKAGIFKSGITAFTVPQCDEAMGVLNERAKEKRCNLHVCPSLDLYPQRDLIKLGIDGEVQKLNASLAIQLAYFWVNKHNNRNYEAATFITKGGRFGDVFPLGKNVILGLKDCKWAGRFQIVKEDNITYFLDGAHTTDSMEHCSKWFYEESTNLSKKTGKTITRILIFNCTGERHSESLLKPIESKFNYAIFCPNRSHNVKDVASDQSNFTISAQKEIELCNHNATIWQKYNEGSTISKFPCISDAISFINSKGSGPIHVLVTGSIHLVGGVLGIIQPDGA